jgi:hypothetical protein
MAGRFAAAIGRPSLARSRSHPLPGAKQLVLTHFSARYGSGTPSELAVMTRIADMAAEAGHPVLAPGSVIAAHDFLSVRVPIHRAYVAAEEEEETR